MLVDFGRQNIVADFILVERVIEIRRPSRSSRPTFERREPCRPVRTATASASRQEREDLHSRDRSEAQSLALGRPRRSRPARGQQRLSRRNLGLEWYEKTLLKTQFYLLMFGAHFLLGLGLMMPFLVFAFVHLATAWKRPNKGAVRYGLALLTASLIIVVTGLILVRLDVPSFSGKGKLFQLELKDPGIRRVGYWLHVLAPVAAIGLYIRHRLAGPRIKWGWVKAWAGSVAAFVIAMGFLHSYSPRPFGVAGSVEGERYFFPSESLTADGNFIPARAHDG